MISEAANVIWQPIPPKSGESESPQARFLASGAFEALYGGAAGGGKSEALIAAAIRHADKPGYTGIIFRRTYPELEKYIVERTRELYPRIYPGARYADKCWRFPSGARVFLSHLEHEHDRFLHQGAQYQFVGFDELTHFAQCQYEYLISRTRGTSGIPVRIRATTNPGGEGHSWVFQRWAPWLDPKSSVTAKSGESLYYLNTNDGPRWCEKGTTGALSRVFVSAKLEDNPYLSKDPQYRQQLMGLDAITRAQLLDGSWTVREVPGALWTVKMLDECRVASHPELLRKVVAIDPSVKKDGAGDECGIGVVGVGMCDCKGPGKSELHAFVLEDLSGHLSPWEWGQRAVGAYVSHDADCIVAEVNNGGALVEVNLRAVELADGTRGANVPYKAVHAAQNKRARAEPVSALYKQGKVHHVGRFDSLESELTTWLPLSGLPSPNRLDWLVWAGTELMLGEIEPPSAASNWARMKPGKLGWTG